MIVILLALIIGIFFLTYKYLGNDIFAPAVVICLSYILAISCALINVDYWQINFEKKTVFYMASGIIFIVIANCLTYFLIQKKVKSTAKNVIYKQYIAYKIPNLNIFLVCLYCIFAISIYYSEVNRIGNSKNFIQMMYNFRHNIKYNGMNVSLLANQLVRLIRAASVVCLYIFSHNVFLCHQKVKDNFNILLPVFFDLVYSLLSSGRYRFLEIPLEVVYLYAFFFFANNGIRIKITVKNIIKALIAMYLLLLFFYMIRLFSGRLSSQTIVEYVTSYFGGSTELFDLWMKDYKGPTSQVFGAQTFSAIYKYLNKFLKLNIDMGGSGEFRRSVNGILIGNVYTTFRDYIQDFGYWGMILLSFITSLIWSYFYYLALVTTNVMRKMIFSYLSYAIVLHSYSEQFFTVYLSIDIWMILLLIYFTYLFFTRIKIKI